MEAPLPINEHVTRLIEFKDLCDAVVLNREASRGLTLQSPLEASFALWFRECQLLVHAAEPCTLRTQVPVQCDNGRNYRLDFQVVAHIGYESYPLKLAVELDGHAYHERTKHQVRQRDQRDRDLQDAGWRVYHFSFSEFDNSPSDCVFRVLDTADQMRAAFLRGEAE